MSNPYTLPDGNVQISFSGGRTSGFMLHQILEANGGLPDRAKAVFANTGREMPETLDFVEEIASRWSVKIDWVEYDLDDEGLHIFKVVNHNSASRNGEPFDLLIDKYGRLPNAVQRFCTGKLKITTTNKFLKAQGWRTWSNALGIRADEPNRIKDKTENGVTAVYPLARAGARIADVNDFWKKQPFDLRLPTINGKTTKGNCDFCFLKSEATLALLSKEHPELAEWWVAAEKRTGQQFNRDRNLGNFFDFTARQQDWVFDQEDFFCQADGGECTR